MVTANVFSFLLNRIFENWTNEAVYLVDQAPPPTKSMHVCEEFVGAGPFFVLNLAGGNPLTYESQIRSIAEARLLQSLSTPAVGDKPGTSTRSAPKWMSPETKTGSTTGCWALVFSQCFDIADRGIGTREDLNFGSLVALGFKKGVFDIMEELGEKEVKRIMDAFNKERPGFPQPKSPLPTTSISIAIFSSTR